MVRLSIFAGHICVSAMAEKHPGGFHFEGSNLRVESTRSNDFQLKSLLD